jgi:hypothetical protein
LSRVFEIARLGQLASVNQLGDFVLNIGGGQVVGVAVYVNVEGPKVAQVACLSCWYVKGFLGGRIDETVS